MTACFHCGLPCDEPPRFTATVNGVEQPMCCPGCKAVCELIEAGGLGQFYQQRTALNEQAASVDAVKRQQLQLYDDAAIQRSFVDRSGNHPRAHLAIEGITCGACVWLLEHYLQQQPGVIRVQVNLTQMSAQITWDETITPLSELLLQVHQLGYTPHPWQQDQHLLRLKQENQRFLRGLAVAGIGAMQVMMVAVSFYFGGEMEPLYRQLLLLVSVILATPVVFYSAAPFFAGAWRGVTTGHIGMDLPIAIAIGSSYAASLWNTFISTGEVYYDSVTMFTLFLLTGRYLEFTARYRACRSAKTLDRWLPSHADKRDANGDWQRVDIAQLQPADCVRVLAGQTFPADGIIVSGDSSADEAMLTGETEPVSKSLNSTVWAGTLNLHHPIEMRVQQVGETTRAAAIAALSQHAEQDKPPVAQLAERVGAYFISAVLIIAAIVAAVWWWLEPSRAFEITLSVLVVSCPCALSLATPTALSAATAALQKRGLLIRKPHALSALSQINAVVFDKTGTLTHGEMILLNVQPLTQLNAARCTAIASALEQHSEHPIASAFADSVLTAQHVHVHRGEGISGAVDGTHYRLGTPAFAHSDASTPPAGSGRWILLADDEHPLCWFNLSDGLREDSATTVYRLQQQGYNVALLSGDLAANVTATAQTLNIDHVESQQSPQDKLRCIQQWQQAGWQLMMVGDGLNDGPVLAAANLSVAIGKACDVTRTQADAVLLNNRLATLVDAINIGHKTQSIIKQNLAWALTYNVVALPLAACGFVHPWMAALGMTASSLLVTLNALRLRR